jgi:hypothetical protein
MATTKKQSVTVAIQAPKTGNAPANLLAKAELQFQGGLLSGIRLTGIALWKAQRQSGRFVSVTFPAQSVEKNGGGVAYFDHLRGKSEDVKRLKGAIVQAYREFAQENGLDVAEDLSVPECDAPESTPF